MDDGGRNGVQPLLVGKAALCRGREAVHPTVPSVRICNPAPRGPRLAPRTAHSQQLHAGETPCE